MSLPPLIFALVMWFIGTAAVVWLDSRPRATFRASLIGCGALAVGALVATWLTAGATSREGAYAAFAAAIVVWGWHEMSFLMGAVAGTSRAPLPEGVAGWARFRLATAAVIHHEIALGATLLLLVALTWGQPNQVAPLTFALLFAMRLSAKFNLFLGVPNLSDEVFPEHLAYLKSYFRKRAMNALFPVSIVGSAIVVVWAWQVAEAAPLGSGAAATGALLAGLGALGLVEHLFLVLPLKDGAMWRWASNKRTVETGTTPPAIDYGEAR